MTGELVVVTFNIRNGRAIDGRHSWPFRRRSTAEILRRLDADVVGLQEAFGRQLRYLLRVLEAYEAAGDGRSAKRTGERNPVLTRRSRIRVQEATTRWYGDDPDQPGSKLPGARFPRIATLTRLVDEETKFEFNFVNTHLDERVGANRIASLDQLAGWLPAGRPTILLGDLNTTPDDEAAFAKLRAAGLRPALPSSAPGTAHNFRGGTMGPRIDHILVSPEFELVGAAVVADEPGPLPSDHWPVRALVRYNA